MAPPVRRIRSRRGPGEVSGLIEACTVDEAFEANSDSNKAKQSIFRTTNVLKGVLFAPPAFFCSVDHVRALRGWA